MLKLKELLTNEKVRFVVEKEDYKHFFYWLKENDCLWRDGKIIQPEVNKFDEASIMLVVTKDKLVYRLVGYFSNFSVSRTPKYYFKDICKDIVKDIDFEEQVKLRQSIEDKEKAIELERALFEERLKHQREINKRQLKYQKYTKKLPRQFFVKYKDTNELIKLFFLLETYGYENYFNINPMYLDDKPCVLHVDNKGMNFSPANVMRYACAVTVGMKIYTYKQLETMFISIFVDSD